MGYFAEFLNGEPTSDVLVNPARLNETADIIRKLYLIAQELPETQFEAVRMKIFETYKQTEKSLLMKFRQASQDNNIEQMQLMADTLSSYESSIYFWFLKFSDNFWFLKNLWNFLTKLWLKLSTLPALCGCVYWASGSSVDWKGPWWWPFPSNWRSDRACEPANYPSFQFARSSQGHNTSARLFDT